MRPLCYGWRRPTLADLGDGVPSPAAQDVRQYLGSTYVRTGSILGDVPALEELAVAIADGLAIPLDEARRAARSAIREPASRR